MDSSGVHEVINYSPSLLPGEASLLPAGERCSRWRDNHTSYATFHSLLAKHYDADTTEPISCSLRSLEELLSWKRNEANPFNVAAVPLAPREPPLARSPRRTMVSHDMMGGYLEDRYGSMCSASSRSISLSGWGFTRGIFWKRETGSSVVCFRGQWRSMNVTQKDCCLRWCERLLWKQSLDSVLRRNRKWILRFARRKPVCTCRSCTLCIDVNIVISSTLRLCRCKCTQTARF